LSEIDEDRRYQNGTSIFRDPLISAVAECFLVSRVDDGLGDGVERRIKPRLSCLNRVAVDFVPRSFNAAPIFSGPVVFEWMGSLALGILVTPSEG
jgi:hypothetical protein